MSENNLQSKQGFIPTNEMSAKELLTLLLSWQNQSWGVPTSTWQALVPGTAPKIQELNDKFLETVRARNLSDLAISRGNLVVDKVSKPYLFVAQGMGDGVLTIMAIRLEAKGNDLFVQWEHFGIKARNYSGSGKVLRLLGGGLSILALGITVFLSGFLAWKWLSEGIRGRTVYTGNVYSNYQANDAWAFREGINDCLKSTFNAAGISVQSIKEIHHHHYA